MQHLVRNSIITIVIVLIALVAITPPKEKLRLGKDLAGGVSLVYGVGITPGQSIQPVIDVVKERLDPNGVLEISIVAQGNDRIEITMPLPSSDVKALRATYEEKARALGGSSLTTEQFDRIASLPAAERDAEIAKIQGIDPDHEAKIRAALEAFDRQRAARERYDESRVTIGQVQALIDGAKAEGKTDEDPDVIQWTQVVTAAQAARDAAASEAAQAALDYDTAREAALARSIEPAELTRALSLSNREVHLPGGGDSLPSPRSQAIAEIKASHPEISAKLDEAIGAWNEYESNRSTLDDPQDIVRILRGAGILNFRITVDPGAIPEQAARDQLKAGGPRSVRVPDVQWFKINKVQNWVRSAEQLKLIEDAANVPAFFASREGAGGYVVERYRGEYYMLLWDKPGMRLTQHDGTWQVVNAGQGSDELGRPSITFEMDAPGATRLGDLTGPNVNNNMAVLLDDEVYTAPNLNSRIARSGQIMGNFTPEELRYIIRVLNSGSLRAKLSPEPLSQTVLAPTLGKDNLDRGFNSGLIAFAVVTVFMIVYYFLFGLVAIIAMAINALLLVGAMALAQAPFTLPGIAGIVLTFGQAIDANVLIYERIREEMSRGHDLRTAVRLGYDRALSAIVDGNVTTLIVCVVLGFLGTQEIRGFGVTLGIGVVTTLFAQLFFTRIVFALLVDKMRVRKMSMFTLVFPGFARALVPSVDWMRLRHVFYAVSGLLCVASVVYVFSQGRELLGIDFRGGTAVTIVLRDPDTKEPHFMSRQEVDDRLDDLRKLSAGSGVEVVVVNPTAEDATRSSTFRIRSISQDAERVAAEVNEAFSGFIDASAALKFRGSDQDTDRTAPIYPITTNTLGESIDDATIHENVEDFAGGAAIVLRDLDPAPSIGQIEDRLRQLRSKPDSQDISGREVRVVLLEGTPERVTTAVILVREPRLSYFDNRDLWISDVRAREWRLVRDSLTTNVSMASVESFSASVAATFRNAAISALLLATVMIVVYVWVRFGSFRYSAGAIVPTIHDCIIAVGAVAVSAEIYNRFPGVAGALGILPFKIDLNMVAAILAILGYSLNDTIVTMDRIRELRGKLPYASRQVINDGINQTISRTVITGGTTLISVLVLYIYGGEGVRAFAYTMLIGTIVGTYSSIAIAAPLVWDRKADPHADDPTPPSTDQSRTMGATV